MHGAQTIELTVCISNMPAATGLGNQLLPLWNGRQKEAFKTTI
jgi:hypothetical protein